MIEAIEEILEEDGNSELENLLLSGEDESEDGRFTIIIMQQPKKASRVIEEMVAKIQEVEFYVRLYGLFHCRPLNLRP